MRFLLLGLSCYRCNYLSDQLYFFFSCIYSTFMWLLEIVLSERTSLRKIYLTMLLLFDCSSWLSGFLNVSWSTVFQIMAIGTCAICYNNVNVFRGVVKMRRGKTYYVTSSWQVVIAFILPENICMTTHYV